jgi:glycosyltransferase involved in cell wall biosynthesis
MQTPPALSYVLPVHNQEAVLDTSVRSLHKHLQRFPNSEILLVENGSSDGSELICRTLAAELDRSVTVRVATSAQGMGHALRTGMAAATGDVVVLTAADLPFGFSDLDGYLALSPRPEIAIGSKAHPDSHTDVTLSRHAMSEAFRWVRGAVLDLHVRDSQGTILISAALCRRVLPHLECGDFLISTEIVCWAVKEGARPVELPVAYPRSARSTVSPVRDSARMLAGTFALRRRLRAQRAHAGASLQT